MNNTLKILLDRFHSPLARAAVTGDREAVEAALESTSPFATEEGLTALELASGLFGSNRAVYADHAAQRYGAVIELLLAAMRQKKGDYVAAVDAEDQTIAIDDASIAAISDKERYKNIQRLAYVRARASQTDAYAALIAKANDLSGGHSHPALREELVWLGAQDREVWDELTNEQEGTERREAPVRQLKCGGARHRLRVRTQAKQEQAA